MAVRFRKDRLRWQVYWKNPFTGKQESAFYATEKRLERRMTKLNTGSSGKKSPSGP